MIGFTMDLKLVWARAITSSGKEARASGMRYVGQVRAAHAAGKSPRLEQVSLDLEGRGHELVLYRLYSGAVRNAKSIVDENSAFSVEPNLFLERSIRLMSSSVAGDQLPFIGDVIVYEGVPYFLKWSGGSVLIYAAFVHRNRPLIPDEQRLGRTFIIPTLRCVFESRPTH